MTAVLGIVPAQLSQAEPRPTISEVQRRIDALNTKIASVNEDYDGSRLDLAAAKRRAGVAQSRVRGAEAQLKVVQKSIQAIAAAAYRSGGTDKFVQLISTSTPQTFLDRASSLDRIAAGQSAQMAAAATARHRFAAARAEATQQQADQQAIATKMARQKSQIEEALVEQERLLGSLKADERRQLAAQQAASLRAASNATRASRSRAATYNGPASGRAAIAVREAYRQLGKPYQWGAAGPDRFDCSGLTMWVWGKAGVSLPHQSRAQYAGGRKVSQSDLRPGDLVFYGSPIHHVGIYIGNGQKIAAPQTGDVVKIGTALRSDYVGAIRP
ncbi:MAG TPA: NlpC/P60 family protein [Mycobacteriales bacterium]|nr:NlpC/P60 family protein [Mycobacteriales bacterium]